MEIGKSIVSQDAYEISLILVNNDRALDLI